MGDLKNKIWLKAFFVIFFIEASAGLVIYKFQTKGLGFAISSGLLLATLLLIFLSKLFLDEIEKAQNEEAAKKNVLAHERLLAEEEIYKSTQIFNEVYAKLNNYNKELEEEVVKRTEVINKQQMVLTNASKMAALGEMAGCIAHEINNPLAIISSTCTYLKKSIQNERFNPQATIKSLNDIEKTVSRISKIIKGLKVISRDTSDEGFSLVNLREILDDVVGLCSEKLKNNNVQFIIDLRDPVYDYMIECRRVQISQIFVNLIGNAYDAVENLPDRWIKIDCFDLKDSIEFKVTDSGTGVPEEIQEKVFNPFFTTKPIGKGTGLGLSISISIVKDHNGTFKIDKENPNTCFVMSLPIMRKAS